MGCYCKDESRCHRSILREPLIEDGADVVSSTRRLRDADADAVRRGQGVFVVGGFGRL